MPGHETKQRDYFPAAWLWSITIVGAWLLLAWHFAQPPWRAQHSRALAAFGAFKGKDLSAVQAWRLIASQWLHVNFAHMAFNAVMIGSIGNALHKRTSASTMLVIGVLGGSIGQFIGALVYPYAFISGASQAYLALCGAALLLLSRSQWAWWIGILGTMVSVGLDLAECSPGGIKMGHLAAFVAGLAAGASIVAIEASQKAKFLRATRRT